MTQQNRMVTSFIDFDKKRRKVYLDDEFAFVLYKGEFKSLDIKEGGIISEETYEKIMHEILPKRAKKRALNLLTKKDYTEKQLRDKLAEGYYAQEIIDDAIEYVKSYGYIDDYRYARDYITYYREFRSKNRIIADLSKKGIDKEISMHLFDEYSTEEQMLIEKELIKKEYLKKVKSMHEEPTSLSHQQKQKIIGFLFRKGFRMDLVEDIVANHLT